MNEYDLIGDFSKKRMLAFGVDSGLATIVALVGAGMINHLGDLAVIITLGLAYLAYFFIFETLWSRTPGKYFFGLRVCQMDGSRCSVLSALLRTLLRIIEVNPVLFGALPAGLILMITERKQRLGDLLAGTVVISNKLFPESTVDHAGVQPTRQ